MALLSELCEAPLARVLADNVATPPPPPAHAAHAAHAPASLGAEPHVRASSSHESESLLLVGSGAPGAASEQIMLSWRSGLLAIATDVAAALAYLHSKGVAHGGLLLNDVLLTSGWRAKICEYGMDGLRGGRGAAATSLEIFAACVQKKEAAATK